MGYFQKIQGYSLTDFHDFDECPFRFLVRHHLNRKYEIDQGNDVIALGNLLDQAIKKFHKDNLYGCRSSAKIKGLIDESATSIKAQVARAQLEGKHQFYESTVPFLTPEIIEEAKQIFLDYYIQRKGKINQALWDVGFCKYPIACAGDNFLLWGGADTLELGEDGVPEVCDYKSRKNLENGKAMMDMDLMPKMYVLLCSPDLLKKGYKKARFKVKIWQAPLDESLYEEFDLETMTGMEFIFRQRIERIINLTDFKLCDKKFCSACKSEKKDEFLQELAEKGFRILSGEEFMKEQEESSDNFLPF